MTHNFEYGSMLGPDGLNKWKCQKHPRMWLKKGQCEICLREAEMKQKEYERTGGSNKPPVKLGTTDNMGKEST